MKKVIVAFFAGALLMLTGQTLADTVSQIGKKVDSESAVYVNGNRVSDAIIIKGKSYAPARDIAETLGATVEWKGSEGIMITNGPVTDEEIAEYNAKIIEYNNNLAKISASILTSQKEIERLENSIAYVTKQLEKEYPHQLHVDYLNQQLSDLEKQLEEEQANLARYEQELVELEASK